MSFHTRAIALVTVTATALATAGALLLSAPGAQAAPLPPGTLINETLFGMHVVDLQRGNWPTIPIGSIRLWDNQTSWADIETTNGNYNWINLDSSVNTAVANGTKDILLVLGSTPRWASDDPSPIALPMPGSAGMPTDLAWWDRWVTAVVTRYKGKITSYQPWNEANLSTFSTGSAAEMAELTKRAYDIIKSIDPAATVVAPSTGVRLGGAFKKFYPKYLAELAKRDWPVDVFSAHTYPASLGSPKDRAALANQWIAALKAAGAPNKPLWDTENNFGLAGPGPANPDQDITGSKAAQWTARTYLDALRLGISRVYWYSWRPDLELLGIQMNTGSDAAIALQTMESWITGATFQKCTTKGALVTCGFKRNGKAFDIVWSEGQPTNAKVGAFSNKCELDGRCAPISQKKLKVTGPTYFQ